METIMLLFIKKYSALIFLFLIFTVFWSSLFSPTMMPAFVIATILFSLVTSLLFILEKHKGVENQRRKIIRDVLILIVMFILVILLGGWIGLWAGKQVEGRFGAVVAVICALLVSFIVGYLVQKGAGKLIR
jgi:heme A synthase